MCGGSSSGFHPASTCAVNVRARPISIIIIIVAVVVIIRDGIGCARHDGWIIVDTSSIAASCTASFGWTRNDPGR